MMGRRGEPVEGPAVVVGHAETGVSELTDTAAVLADSAGGDTKVSGAWGHGMRELTASVRDIQRGTGCQTVM